MHGSKVYKTLTYAGALPFLACALAPYAGFQELGALGTWDEVIVVYGLAITSFIAGTHWAFELARPGCYPVSLFVMSNAVVLAVWLAALAAPPAIAMAAELIALLVLLRVDRAVAVEGGTPEPYYPMRQRVTLFVVLALIIGIAATWLA